ncbi:Gmad2 immunoglobulin-like domain-containing protein [Knoellia sp. CPCC 206450]|uniref:Gmad2 immunoglobulin-like domain-containing protein n=1 Tax=Knoellia tibetensis TaxID=3404798 RepID=UPI003B43835F
MTTHQDESQTERELRAALDQRAREIRPSSRLDAILDEASGPGHGTVRRSWWAVAAVAATAALVGGIVWAARPDDDGTLPATPAPTTSVPSPSASPSPTPSSSSSASPSASPSATGTPTGTGTATLGIYVVGSNGGEQARHGLVREFSTLPMPENATESDRATLAVVESIRSTDEQSDPWSGVALDRLVVERGRITIELTGPGGTAPDARRAELAVSALVWTAQAAVGRGDLPVTVRTPGGQRLFGHLDPARVWTRASTPPEFLCDLWVDSPAPGASVRATQPVVVRGQAVAFEAALEWDLRRGATVVKDGFTTASIGAPSRGTFSVDLGRLDAGTYTFRAFTTSAEDGSVFAERSVTFTVR